MSLGVSFETCLRRRGDVLTRCRCYVLSRRRHDVPIRRRGDVPLRRLGDVPSRCLGCFIWDLPAMSPARTYRRRYDVATTSCCRVGCDYCDAYIVVKRTITVEGTNDTNKKNKKLIYKNSAPFRSCISKIINTLVGNAEDLDIVMPMCNLLEYSNNYYMTS